MMIRTLEELIEKDEPAIRLLQEWAASAEVDCDLLPPSSDRERVLLNVQVTTRSPLGALVYDTGGLIIQNGWLRFLGSGHPRLPRRIDAWNRDRANGLYLVADDAVGGFFALNGGALGSDHGRAYYWAPDNLDWLPLDFDYTDLLQYFLSFQINKFYEELRWPSWKDDVAALPGDRSFHYYPFLWTKEGSITTSHRATVPTWEVYDQKVDFIRQTSEGEA
jgi:hypothetical protein